jgi:hypothetical protein
MLATDPDACNTPNLVNVTPAKQSLTSIQGKFLISTSAVFVGKLMAENFIIGGCSHHPPARN